jgi:hypothetical protein
MSEIYLDDRTQKPEWATVAGGAPWGAFALKDGPPRTTLRAPVSRRPGRPSETETTRTGPRVLAVDLNRLPAPGLTHRTKERLACLTST